MSQANRNLLWLTCLVAATGAQAQMTEVVVHNFRHVDGIIPAAGLLRDESGDLYGTTSHGGASRQGVVFKLDRSHRETALYNFCAQANCADGANPLSGVIRDADGNLYGTTLEGGASDKGVVYKLDPSGNETVLFSFCSDKHCADGAGPGGEVIRDSAGNLYGATGGGGKSNSGVVYKLDASGDQTVLYRFCSQTNCADGNGPIGGVIRDADGNLYGVTVNGGTSNYGVVYKVDTSGNETVLYSFCSQAGCADGGYPYAGLIRDSEGNLYGTTRSGGNGSSGGVVFKLDAAGNETVLYSFCSRASCADGADPYAGVTRDSAGNLYGTTNAGGASGYGTVFKLDTSGDETVLYSFCSETSCAGGQEPAAGVVLDNLGHVYGTATGGGKWDRGVVFELKP
jgi:uncharacterized repeat protein (TIGR03803 family)